MTGRHSNSSQPMHADDPVAPGIKRSRSAYLVAAGLLIIVGAVAGSITTLSTGVKDAKDSANLSADEVGQLREFLADRGEQRDTERAQVQEQLDDQRAVLCAAILTLRASATRAEPRRVLDKAATDLHCASLPLGTATTPPAGSTPKPAATRATTSAASPRATAAGRTPARAKPAPTPRQGTPAGTARPTPKATPTPATTTPPARILDPATDPVCQLLTICL